MRGFALIILFKLFTCYSFASSEPPDSGDLLASELMIPLFNTGKQISIEDFLKLTPKVYKQIAGRKMRINERVGLLFGKKQLKRMVNKDGTVKLDKIRRGGFWGGFKWHWGGFAMGLVFNILAPILCLFANDERKWDRFWTALHTAIYVWLLFGLAILVFVGRHY